MEGNKDLFASKTTWGVLLAIVGPLLVKYFGIDPDLDALAASLAEATGLALALWGQLTRKKAIATVAGLPLKATPKLLAFLVPVLFMIGCATPAPRGAQDYVNEGNILLTAIADTVTANVRAGTMTLAERDAIMRDWHKYAGDMRDAQSLINIGQGTQAQQRAQIINAAIKALHKKVAANARGAHNNERLGHSERYFSFGRGRYEYIGSTRTPGARARQWTAGVGDRADARTLARRGGGARGFGYA